MFLEFKTNLKLLFIYFLIAIVNARSENEFIIDYFNYKNISNVVGFSCNTIEDDFLLMRDLNRINIAVSLNKLQNISKINVIARTNYWKLGIFLDVRCHDAKNIALMFYDATNYRIFDELRYWLILGSKLEAVLPMINDQAFGTSTDLIIAETSDTQTFKLYDVYNTFKIRGTLLNVTFFGVWSKINRFNISLTQSKFERRSNLHGFNLKAMFWKCTYKPDNVPLDVYLDDYANATKDAQSKFGFHILTHLSEMFNFSLSVAETPKWLPGDALGPIITSLQNNSADFTGTPISITTARTYLLKYVHPAWPFRTCFIFRNPQPTNMKIQEILRPLTEEVWYLIAALFLISTSILTTVLRYEHSENSIVRLSNSVLLMVGALCQQGTDLKMQHISTRIAFFFVLVFSLLIYNYYSASVVSARLDEPIVKINDSLNELGKLHMKMSSEWMVYLEFFLKAPDWDTRTFLKDYWSKLPESERYVPPELAIRLVQKGDYAYHTHPYVGYVFIDKLFDNREICELMEVHIARPILTTFGVPTNSSITEISRVGLARISEVGIRQRQIFRWQYRKPVCRKDILSATSVTIYEFAPHLLLLIIGICLAMVMYAVEVFVKNHQLYVKQFFSN